MRRTTTMFGNHNVTMWQKHTRDSIECRGPCICLVSQVAVGHAAHVCEYPCLESFIRAQDRSPPTLVVQGHSVLCHVICNSPALKQLRFCCRVEPKYEVHVPSHSFVTQERTYNDVLRSYTRLYIASDFTHLLANWTQVCTCQLACPATPRPPHPSLFCGRMIFRVMSLVC